MKVIKEGINISNPFSFDYTCVECKSILLVEESDMEIYNEQQEGPTPFFTCPLCSTKQGNYRANIPAHVLKRLKCTYGNG